MNTDKHQAVAEALQLATNHGFDTLEDAYKISGLDKVFYFGAFVRFVIDFKQRGLVELTPIKNSLNKQFRLI